MSIFVTTQGAYYGDTYYIHCKYHRITKQQTEMNINVTYILHWGGTDPLNISQRIPGQ